MSSSYYVLCLSHAPALHLDQHYQTPAAAEQHIADGVGGHESCDLMIARVSGGLASIGCPARHCYHGDTQWADVSWLRILGYAHREPDGSNIRAATSAPDLRCWTPDRMQRLGVQLSIDEEIR